jgi:hypothetical protein
MFSGSLSSSAASKPNYGVVDVLCVSNGFLVGVIDMAEKGLGAL